MVINSILISRFFFLINPFFFFLFIFFRKRMVYFGSKGNKAFSKIEEEEEETEPLHHGETIEMTTPGYPSSSSHFQPNDGQPIYRKIGRLAEEGWTSVANLVTHPQQQRPRSSTHMDVDDPAPPIPEINNDLKRKLYLILEEPASSTSAFWVNVIVSFLIVFSAVTTTIETIPSFRSTKGNRVW